MKPQQVRFARYGKIKALNSTRPLGLFWKKIAQPFRNFNIAGISGSMGIITQKSHHFLEDIKSIGFTKTMDDLERRKLSIFNQLNFFQFITGVIVPVTCFLGNGKLPVSSFFIAILPALVSFLVLYLNLNHKYEAGIIAYFILYPLVTSIVYMRGMNLGVELFFIL